MEKRPSIYIRAGLQLKWSYSGILGILSDLVHHSGAKFIALDLILFSV